MQWSGRSSQTPLWDGTCSPTVLLVPAGTIDCGTAETACSWTGAEELSRVYHHHCSPAGEGQSSPALKGGAFWPKRGKTRLDCANVHPLTPPPTWPSSSIARPPTTIDRFCTHITGIVTVQADVQSKYSRDAGRRENGSAQRTLRTPGGASRRRLCWHGWGECGGCGECRRELDTWPHPCSLTC